jgi:hypothetical protein
MGWAFLVGLLVGAGAVWILNRPAPGPDAATVTAALAARDSAERQLDSLRALSAATVTHLAAINAVADSLRALPARALVVDSVTVETMPTSAHAGAALERVTVPAAVVEQLRLDRVQLASMTAARDTAQLAVARLTAALEAADTVTAAADRAHALVVAALRSEVAHQRHQLVGWKLAAAGLAVALALSR